MAEINATILIPDISGFTQFMTSTELSHSSLAINMLIDAMINAVEKDYEVSEIEGDAVLLIKKGPVPGSEAILNSCLTIFNAFHFQRKWMQQYTICPCGACQAIDNLTLKFVVHHGPLVEMKVGGFVKQSGTEMIVAHRLLKNSIDNHEYLLVTEKLWKQVNEQERPTEIQWRLSTEEYPSIGKIDYRFALLGEARKRVPEPPAPKKEYHSDDTPYVETTVNGNFRDVCMVVIDIPGRPAWVPGLVKVEQETPNAFVGSIHYCSFEGRRAVVSPIQMHFAGDHIVYAESCTFKDTGISVIHEFRFTSQDENHSRVAARVMHAGSFILPNDLQAAMLQDMEATIRSLKNYCEPMAKTGD